MSVPESTVRSRLWVDGVLQEENFPFEKISDYLEQDGCLVWVDVCDPDHQLLLRLAEELTLDPLAIEDAVSHGERAKATRYATHTFLTAYAVGIRDTGGSRDAGGSRDTGGSRDAGGIRDAGGSRDTPE